MRRFFSLLLAITLVLGIATPALAADASKFTDIEGHWAKPYIEEVVSAGLMNGISETTFSPNTAMTRSMFVTVLGRMAGIDPNAWKLSYEGVLYRDIQPEQYYIPYVNWATRMGITSGIGGAKFDPNGMITREQMLTMLQRYAKVTGKAFESPILGDEGYQLPAFTDASQIADWAKDAVNELRSCGIVQGIANADGTLRFAPKQSASRAEAATIFSRMDGVLVNKSGWSETFATLVVLSQNVMEITKGESITLTAQLFPASTTNQTITWVSSNPAIASVDGGKVRWESVGVCTIYAYSSNGCKAECDVVCEYPPSKENTTPTPDSGFQDLTLANGNESYAQKCERIFGKSVSDPRAVYASKAEAQKDMVSLTVPVWDIGSSGAKYTRYFTLEVHKNIAATVDQIFREIYACDAKYPIHSLGGFRYEARSEHNCGLAIDINPNENYYCSPQGQALVGSFFSPEKSEYSIPVNGEIDQIFKKYGFTRGIYWRSGYKDYMHYSFFGT
ncbi:MAG: hypothetical protein E7464_07490 [Ruminococcaceae bacterium]|nr:hypothetical protein [Oscillospiraceae bacterium]